MKKTNIKRTQINDPVLHFVFYVQHGGTEFSAYKWMLDTHGFRLPENVGPGVDGNSGSFGVNSAYPYWGVIWLAKDCGGSTVAHEVAHAVTNVCRVLELNPVNADEFYSSYLGWLFKEVNIFLQGKKK